MSGLVNVAPGAGAIPPGAAGLGNYGFLGVTVACVGTYTGVAVAASAGNTGPGPGGGVLPNGLGCGAPALPGAGQFCGPYTTGPFLGSGGTCAGDVGGPGYWGAPAGPIGPWSLTVGNVITGWIDCNGGTPNIAGTSLAGVTVGAITLVALPNPAGPACLPPPAAPPLPPPAVWFCQLVVTGVAVVADPA
ncbi:MAG TPA: hypothetical protein VF230_03115 [Acidimicrobiales bacterium]